MSIQIEGLNKKQRALADIMWGMDSKAEVSAFIASLQGQNKQEAQTVLEMMLWAIWDEVTLTDEAKVALDKVFNR